MLKNKKTSRIYAARANRELAVSMLESWWPDATERRITAEFFVRTIEVAHPIAPGSWEVSLLPGNLLRVNVGPVAVLDLYGGEDGIAVVYASEQVSPGRVPFSKTQYGRYSAIEGFRGRAWAVRLADLSRLSRAFVRTHHELVERAAETRSITTWKGSHSPAPVAVLAEWAGTPPLIPDYLSEQAGALGVTASSARWELEPPDPETERRAVEEATRILKAEGWRVESREEVASLGYDLLCTRRREERHVEVKGSAWAAIGFRMQRSQYTRAQTDPDFELIYVSEVMSGRPIVARYRADAVFDHYVAEPMKFALRPKGRRDRGSRPQKS